MASSHEIAYVALLAATELVDISPNVCASLYISNKDSHWKRLRMSRENSHKCKSINKWVAYDQLEENNCM